MNLFTRRLMPAELRLQSKRETQKLDIYFTDYTLTGQPDAFGRWDRTPPVNSTGCAASIAFDRTVLANFISPITLWLGTPGLIRSGSQMRADDPQGQSVH